MKTFFKICFAVVVGTIGCPELNAQNSGNVSLRFVGNDVQLTGDSEDNAVRVSVMPAGNKAIVQVEGLWGTTVNSRTMVSRAVTNLDDIRVNFASGTNRFTLKTMNPKQRMATLRSMGAEPTSSVSRTVALARLISMAPISLLVIQLN